MKPVERIQAALARKGVDALLVSQPENRQYLSGYTAIDLTISESSGFLVVPRRGTPLLLTDARYRLQAEQEAENCRIVLVSSSILETLKSAISRLDLRSLAFESHYMLHTTALKLMDLGRRLKVDVLPTTGMVEKLRLRKSPAEVARIRQAVQLNESVFQRVFEKLKPGKTEKQVALEIETAMMQKGAEGPAFPTIVASGPNAATPHAVPTARQIKEGEPIIIDMGLRLDGYCSDMTRTVFLGKPDRRTVEIIRLVRRAQQAAMKVIKGGILACQADKAARKIIAAAGYGKNFGHGLGHGVGLAVHEGPSLNRRRRNKLLPGMVVTVEPGIYLPGWGGVRLENMVVVEEKKCTVLNKDCTFLDI